MHSRRRSLRQHKAGSGTILIRVEPYGQGLVLSVTDDGKGLSDGFQYEKATSLGLKLVHALARQFRGTVEVSSAKGTSVRMHFPVKDEEKHA